MRDTTHTDHADVLREVLSDIRSWHISPDDDGTADDQLDQAEMHNDALAAERDALLAYAHMITAFAIEIADRDAPTTRLAIARMQEMSGVAELMRDDDA